MDIVQWSKDKTTIVQSIAQYIQCDPIGGNYSGSDIVTNEHDLYFHPLLFLILSRINYTIFFRLFKLMLVLLSDVDQWVNEKKMLQWITRYDDSDIAVTSGCSVPVEQCGQIKISAIGGRSIDFTASMNYSSEETNDSQCSGIVGKTNYQSKLKKMKAQFIEQGKKYEMKIAKMKLKHLTDKKLLSAKYRRVIQSLKNKTELL